MGHGIMTRDGCNESQCVFIEEYGKLILAEMERQNKCSDSLHSELVDIRNEVNNLRRDFDTAHAQLRKDVAEEVALLCKGISDNRVNIAVLNTKAGVWGILGGIVPSTILLAVYLIKTLIA